MWEWRIFFSEKEVPSWISIIEEKLMGVAAEIRSDLYLNLHKPNYGLKIRSYLGNSQLLELKILRSKKKHYELWEKRIKTPIYDDSIDEIIKMLKKHPIAEKILPIISMRENEFVKLEKERKKALVDQVTVEKVIVKNHHKIWHSIEIESQNFHAINNFLKNNLGIDRIKGNTSYPEFLIQYF